MPAPSPWAPPTAEETPAAWLGLPRRGSYLNWAFGDGTAWPIVRADGVFDQMGLKLQDSQLVGDGQVFGWDSEDKRVITIEFGGGLAELAWRCEFGETPLAQDPLIGPRCAMMRRHDDQPLYLDDWVIMARPRRFLAPQRRGEPTTVTAGWEAEDPAIYRYETGPDTEDGWRFGSAGIGIAEWGRPYPPGPGLTYRGPAGAAPWTWTYAGRGHGGLLAVNNDGCREIYLRGEIRGPVVGPILINQTTFEVLEFDLELGPFDTLELDFRRGRAMLNGVTSRYETITRQSVWFACGPGTTFIRYLARGEVTDSTFTAWWRSAW